MSLIDLSIGVVLLWAIYKGFTKGLIVAISSFVSFAVGIWGSIRFSEYLVPILQKRFDFSSSHLPILAFLVTFLCIVAIIYLIAKLVERIVEGISLGLFNKIGGAIFNCSKYLLLIAIFIVVLHNVEKSYPLVSNEAKKNSILYTPIEDIGLQIFSFFKDTRF